MKTGCTATRLELQSFGQRRGSVRFDGGWLTSDGGGLLLREVARRCLYLSSFACLLMHGLRRLGPVGTRWTRAQCTAIRTQILKLAAQVRITARRV